MSSQLRLKKYRCSRGWRIGFALVFVWSLYSIANHLVAVITVVSVGVIVSTLHTALKDCYPIIRCMPRRLIIQFILSFIMSFHFII